MSDPLRELQALIDRHVGHGDPIRLLEAGCGSRSRLRLGDNIEIVGMDISAKQLDRNDGLHERLLADVQTYPLHSRSFDIIVCWDVLEHLPNPDMALRNFFSAIKPGGLIVLAFPNLFSLKGVLTKFTPHIVHVWYYKFLLGVADAGVDDTAPFATPFRLSATYPAVRRLAQRHRGTVEFLALRESWDMQHVRKKFWLLDRFMTLISLFSRLVSLGRIDASHSDCILVVRASPAS